MFSLAKSLHVLSEPHETVTASGERIMAPPLVVEVRNHQNSLAPMGGRRPKKQCATSSNTSLTDILDWNNDYEKLQRLCRNGKANEPDTAQLAYDLAIRGNRIVYPALFALTAACPHCHNVVVHDTDAVGAKIQRPAIHVHEIFAECRACHHMWWGTEIPLLAGSI